MCTTRLNGVLFYGTANLGWKTMAQALREAAPCHPLLTQHVDGSVPKIGNNCRLVRCRAFAAVQARIDLNFRRRSARLRNTIRSSPLPIRHVHAFGHLMAEPQAICSEGLSYSVSTDGTWLQLEREIAARPAELTPARFRRRLAIEGEIFRRASFVSCTSAWAAESVISDYGVDPGRVHVDPFPIVPGPAYPRRADADWLTFIGNDFIRKNGHRLVEWHQRYFAERAPLHLVSSTPLDDLKRRKLVNVVFHGAVDNAEVRQHILPRTRALVLPTSFDQSPLVLTEAAAAGVPTVSTNIAGIPDLVRHGETGLLNSPNDEHAFCRSIADLLENDNLNTEMGHNARLHYESHLRSEAVTDQLFKRLGAL